MIFPQVGFPSFKFAPILSEEVYIKKIEVLDLINGIRELDVADLNGNQAELNRLFAL